MKNKKRNLCALLLSVLLCSFLMGCAPDKSATENQNVKTSNQEESTQGTEQTESEDIKISKKGKAIVKNIVDNYSIWKEKDGNPVTYITFYNTRSEYCYMSVYYTSVPFETYFKVSETEFTMLNIDGEYEESINFPQKLNIDNIGFGPVFEDSGIDTDEYKGKDLTDILTQLYVTVFDKMPDIQISERGKNIVKNIMYNRSSWEKSDGVPAYFITFADAYDESDPYCYISVEYYIGSHPISLYNKSYFRASETEFIRMEESEFEEAITRDPNNKGSHMMKMDQRMVGWSVKYGYSDEEATNVLATLYTNVFKN